MIQIHSTWYKRGDFSLQDPYRTMMMMLNHIKIYVSLLVPWFISVFILHESQGLTVQQITVTDRRGDFSTAQNHCKSLGLKLIRAENEQDNNVVFGVASRLGRYWMDANDMGKEGTFVNSDNEPLRYAKWRSGEPNNCCGGEHCVEVKFFGTNEWNDIACSTNNGIVCMGDEVITNPGPPSQPSQTEVVNIQLVDLPQKTNYENGLGLCKAQNLAMVVADSPEMNKLVYDFAVEKNLGTYWIDLNDNQVEGSWVSSDGSVTPYKNFAPGEPNGGRGENCVHGLFYKNGFWNDVGCGATNAVICYQIVGSRSVRV